MRQTDGVMEMFWKCLVAVPAVCPGPDIVVHMTMLRKSHHNTHTEQADTAVTAAAAAASPSCHARVKQLC